MDINWATKVITVYKTDMFMTFVGGSIYEMDTNNFRLAIQDRLDDDDGVVQDDAINHSTQVLLGGVYYARIIEFINGYTITFDDTGGAWVCNLLGSNNNILDVTNLTTVQVRSNNSAGLINVKEIQQQAFGGGVWIDQANGINDVTYPAGTPTTPVSTIEAAKSIALYRGFVDFYIIGDLTLTAADSVDQYNFIGQNPTLTHITIEPSAFFNDCEITEATVTGEVDGNTTIKDCLITDLFLFSGYLFRCAITGTITLGNGVQGNILDCYSGVAGSGTPTMDLGGSGQALAMRGYTGGILLQNKTGTDGCSIDMQAGQVKIDLTTCTAGKIVIRGVCNVIDAANSEDILTHGYYNGLYLDNYAVTGLMVQEMWQSFGLDPDHPEMVEPLTNVFAKSVWTANPNDYEVSGFGKMLMHMGHVPKAIYFDPDRTYPDRAVIPEYVTNGTFYIDKYWTLPDNSIYIQNGELYFNCGNDTCTATQTLTISAGTYLFQFTVVDVSSGGVQLNCTNHTGTLRTAVGTYSEVVALASPATAIEIKPDVSGFVGEVDNVSVKEYVAFNGDGKQNYPFNTTADVLDYAEAFTFNTVMLMGDFIVDRNVKNLKFEGIGTPEVDANGFDLKNSEFHRIKFKGDYIDSVIVQESVLLNGAYLNGFFENCAVTGSVSVKGGSTTYIKNCASAMPDGFTPNFFIGDDANVNITEWYGKIRISGVNTANSSVILNVANGSVVIDSSCTNGTIMVTGNCVVDDQSGVGCTVTNYALDPTDIQGGGLTETQNTRLQELWQLQGLDAANNLTVTKTARNVASIAQVISGDGQNTTTVSRS